MIVQRKADWTVVFIVALALAAVIWDRLPTLLLSHTELQSVAAHINHTRRHKLKRPPKFSKTVCRALLYASKWREG
jgi:hypothetical protein